jgi:hypothetical protein
MKNKVIYLYMTNILLNAVFNPLVEIVHRSGQLLLIDREQDECLFSEGWCHSVNFASSKRVH